MISLTVNGKAQELEAPMPLADFLERHQVNSLFVAVAYNGTVLSREEFAQVTLRDGDVVEIVRPVGGGESNHPPLSPSFPGRGIRRVWG